MIEAGTRPRPRVAQPTGKEPAMSIVPDADSAPAIIRVFGELDTLTSPALREQVQQALAQRPPAILIDLTAVPFIDSSGLSALVAGLKAAKLQGTALVLFGLQPQARLIFSITQADGLFAIVGTEAEAIAALTRRAV
jgi:anti-anti-sigma factor